MRHEFSRWVKHEIKKRLKIVIETLTTLHVSLSSLTALARYLHVSTLKGFSVESAVSIAYALQLVVIGLLFFVNFRLNPHISLERDKQASDATHQFQKYWERLWMAWFFFYLALSLQSMLVAIGINQPVWLLELLLNALNNLQTVFVLFCYFALAKPKKLRALSLSLWVIYIVYVSLDVAFVRIAQSFPQAAGLGNLSFRLVSGVGMGLALSLMIGRFTRPRIDVPWHVWTAMYLYALIQVLYLMFRNDQYRYFQEFVTALALPLRLVLFAFVSWLLVKGKMRFCFGRPMRGAH